MSFASACASCEAIEREMVYNATWGHLVPEKNKTYTGRIVFAVGCFADGELNPIPLVCDFDGLDSSLWFYDALTEFISDLGNRECGKVFEWNGTFRNYKFRGERQLLLDCNAQVVVPTTAPIPPSPTRGEVS